jgi:hypothetical protein
MNDKLNMNVITPSPSETNGLSIVSPVAQWQADLEQYPTISEWNYVLLNCLWNESGRHIGHCTTFSYDGMTLKIKVGSECHCYKSITKQI